eukprot:m.12370 g.12370  ORF g.12370 m.12370 type:complete len:395 (+) comp7178_c0_seq1:142-1326(+)
MIGSGKELAEDAVDVVDVVDGSHDHHHHHRRKEVRVDTEEVAAEEGVERKRDVQSRCDEKHKYTRKSFKSIRVIGSGTFGNVVLASCPSPHKGEAQHIPCAVKILEKKKVVKLKQVEHTNSENFVLKRCAHPFIGNLIASFMDKKNLYFALEYLPGGEMFRHLRNVTHFSEYDAAFYAAQVLLALEYLHYNSIVYRDLKPENILFTANGYVKLVDFGFAKMIRANRTYTLCGTPDYLAPEVLSMKGYGISVDFWGLGILIFEMCAGYPPFQGENAFKTYKKIVKGKFRVLTRFSHSLRTLTTALLIIQPHARLGVVHGGCQNIKDHPFFVEINWGALLDQSIEPPFIPTLKSPLDDSNFDEYHDVVETALDGDGEDNDDDGKEFQDLFFGFDSV